MTTAGGSGSGGPPAVGTSLVATGFDSRVAAAIAVAVTCSLVITALAMLLGDRGTEGVAHGPSSYSVSAVGFAAFAELLKEVGVPVIASRSASAQRVSSGVPLVILAPDDTGGASGTISEMLERAANREARSVLVLPRWRSLPDPDHQGWAGGVVELPGSRVAAVLGAVPDLDTARVRRFRDGQRRRWAGPLTETGEPKLDGVQLVVDLPADFEPLLECPEGVLAAVSPTRRLTLVSDPGLFDNSGLAANAALAVALVVGDTETEAVVLDETLHGYEGGPSFWRELIEPPLVLFSVQMVLLALLVVWRGAQRMGPPVPGGRRRRPGVATLVETTARLVASAGSPGAAARAYWELSTSRVAERCALPHGLDPMVRLGRLVEIAAARNVKPSPSTLEDTVEGIGSSPREARRAVVLARRIHRWRKEMEHVVA